MKFREHRGNLLDSMLTCVEIPATMSALRTHINGVRAQSVTWTTLGELEVKLYSIMDKSHPIESEGHWRNTYLVTEDGKAIGFTDGPVTIEVFTSEPMVSVRGTDARKRLEHWVDQEIRLAMQQGVDVTSGLDRAAIAQLRRERIIGVILDGDSAAPLTTVPEHIVKSMAGKLVPQSD